VTQPHVAQERKPRADLCIQVARNAGFATLQLQPREELERGVDRQAGEPSDGTPAEHHVQRDRVEALPCAFRARTGLAVEPLVPPDLFPGLFRIETHDAYPGAEARLAPAVLRVVREEPRVGLCKTAAASSTRATRREHAHL